MAADLKLSLPQMACLINPIKAAIISSTVLMVFTNPKVRELFNDNLGR
jgi:hypothetical protein